MTAASLSELHREIERSLVAKADASYRLQIERLVPGIRTIGVRVPKIRALASDFARRHKGITMEKLESLMEQCLATGSRDQILFGAFLLARSKKQLAALSWQSVERWTRAIDNWETCDQIAMSIAAPLVAAESSLVARLVALARDKNLWRRRFALATAAALNQHGRRLPEATLAVCRHVVADEEPMVQKALAWAVREVCKNDAPLARDFLTRHRNALPARVLKAAAAKLAPAARRKRL